jgi:hypothetical protein
MMNNEDFAYHMENLRALDPDQLVSDLNLDTETLLMYCHEEARDFIEENFG